jgi:cytidyltransferase-like protein
MKTVVATSGYFNPLHVGHIECLEKAKALGDELVVIVNSDLQVELKGSKKFQTQEDRLRIMAALKCVDRVVLSIDQDSTQCKTLEMLKPNIFAKGGDRYATEIPESEVCKRLDIKIVDGLGDKIRSSRDILNVEIVNENEVSKIEIWNDDDILDLKIYDESGTVIGAIGTSIKYINHGKVSN